MIHASFAAVGLSHVLVSWQTDPVAGLGVALEITACALYVSAASRPSPRGARWPVRRTASFVCGVAAVAFVLQSGFAGYDDSVFWVHVTQHLVLMMLAPPLIVASAPMTLLLRTLPVPERRRVARVLNHAAMQPFWGRWAKYLLPVDYYGTMFLYMLTGWYAAAQHHQWLHEFTHLYFLTCGLFFWWPLAGADPTRWRPSLRTRTALVGVGIPVYLLLAELVQHSGSVLSSTTAPPARHIGTLVLFWGGSALTGLGLLITRPGSTTFRRRRDIRDGYGLMGQIRLGVHDTPPRSKSYG